MLRKNAYRKVILVVWIFGITMMGLYSHSELTSKAALMPTASITASNTNVKIFVSISFDVNVSPASDSECEDASWTLSYGDGDFDSGSLSGIAIHHYETVGSFIVTLNYTREVNVGGSGPRRDCQTESASDSLMITTRPVDPFSIAITADPQSVTLGDPISFDVDVTNIDPICTPIFPKTWDFGDGNTLFGFYDPTHTYDKVGTYTVNTSFVTACDQETFGQITVSVQGVKAPAPGDGNNNPDSIRFLGLNENWFDASNWGGGSVPGPNDRVVIEGPVVVVIDQAQRPSEGDLAGDGAIVIADLDLLDGAALEFQPGTEIEVGNFIVSTDSLFSLRSSTLRAERLATTPGRELDDGCSNPPWCSPPINPSYVQVNQLELDGLGLAMFLGGVQPAAPGMTGAGYYANIGVTHANLNNAPLTIDLIYDFVPQPGDRFVILEASQSLTGTFSNAPEGSLVKEIGDVGLFIRYEGHQIVLTAEAI